MKSKWNHSIREIANKDFLSSRVEKKMRSGSDTQFSVESAGVLVLLERRLAGIQPYRLVVMHRLCCQLAASTKPLYRDPWFYGDPFAEKHPNTCLGACQFWLYPQQTLKAIKLMLGALNFDYELKPHSWSELMGKAPRDPAVGTGNWSSSSLLLAGI